MELVFSGGCRGESCVALCFGKIQVVGRKGEGEGEEGGVAAGASVGALSPRRCRNEGWALAASLDPWNALADPPLSWGSGDLGSGNRFFFPLSRGVLFACGPERKAEFLPASSCKQGPLET